MATCFPISCNLKGYILLCKQCINSIVPKKRVQKIHELMRPTCFWISIVQQAHNWVMYILRRCRVWNAEMLSLSFKEERQEFSQHAASFMSSLVFGALENSAKLAIGIFQSILFVTFFKALQNGARQKFDVEKCGLKLLWRTPPNLAQSVPVKSVDLTILAWSCSIADVTLRSRMIR